MSKKTVVTQADDPGQIQKAEDAEKDRERDLHWILSTPRGRRFLYDFINDTCHTRRRSHVPGAPDTSAFNEGARSVGEALEEAIRAKNFRGWAAMMAENHSDE